MEAFEPPRNPPVPGLDHSYAPKWSMKRIKHINIGKRMLDMSGLEWLPDRRHRLLDNFAKRVAEGPKYRRWFPSKEFVDRDLRRELVYEEKFSLVTVSSGLFLQPRSSRSRSGSSILQKGIATKLNVQFQWEQQYSATARKWRSCLLLLSRKSSRWSRRRNNKITGPRA